MISKNKYSSVLVLLVGLSVGASACSKATSNLKDVPGAKAPRQFHCQNVFEGDDIGGKFETTVDFTANPPSLTSSVKMTLTGSEPTVTSDVLLSPTKVCGVPLNFEASCTTKEQFGSDYVYSFSCGNNIRGTIELIDKDARMYCDGPQVDSVYHGGIFFEGCR
jgi:hypothetical protein